MKAVGKWAAVAAAIFALVASCSHWIFPGDAWGHSWYDWECCSSNDCFAVPSDDVTEIDNGGWKHLPTGVEFTRQQVKPSKDRRFHVCIGNKAWDLRKPYCIYILQGA